MADFEGGSGPDVYTGSPNADTINGNGGNDTLNGVGGNDVVAGDDGADTIDGGDGDDWLYSAHVSPAFNLPYYDNPFTPPLLDTGNEVDTIRGGNGDDRIFAGYGDNVDGGANGYTGDYLFISFKGATSGVTADFHQSSLVIGGGTITGIENISWVQGSDFDDYIDVGTNSNNGYSDFTAVFGGGGNDHLVAGYYTGVLYGEAGNDILDGRGSQYLQRVDGGDGDDTIYTNSNTFAAAYGGAGNDTIYSHGTTYGGDGDDKIYLQDTYYGGRVYGEAGNDEIHAANTGNYISGGTGADTLIGGSGADYLMSGDFVNDGSAASDSGLEHDVLTGGGGDDTLEIGYGDDADGGTGTNRLIVSLQGATSGVTYNFGSILAGTTTLGGGTIKNIQAVDTVWGSAFADSITMPNQAFTATVHGGAGNDTIGGGTSALTIYGDDGDDTLTGSSGNDTIDGGAGNDTITGGAGLDIIHGGAGYDYIRIGDGDFVAGEVYDAGADGGQLQITASSVVDLSAATVTSFSDLTGGRVKLTGAQFVQFGSITGSTITLTDGGTITGSVFITPLYSTVINLAPVDTVFNAVRSLGTQGDGGLTINGNIGNDTIYGTDLNDSLNGGDGNDTIHGGGGYDYLSGGNGNDVLDGGGSFDDMTGGLGDDTYYIDTSSDTVHENAGEGYDTEIGSVSFVMADNVERGIMAGSGALFGNNGDNVLISSAGGNALYGEGGNDRLEGSAAADTLIGGTGDDTYVLNGADSIVENAGEGNDTIESAATTSLANFANIENLTLTGNAAINGTGDANANVIRGNAAANTLDGGGGADQLYGGAGDDTYIVNNAGVQVFENANEGTDTVRASVSFTLGANVENLVLTGTGNINGYGNSGHNTITGNAGSNVLDGGGGGDMLQGGAGNDVYYVRNAGDVIVEGAGEGTADTVLSFVNYTLNAGAQVERLSAIDANATTAIDLTGNAYSHLIQGNAGVNTLTGGSGDDKLYGYGGDDRLYGGAGNDTLYGGTGNDTYVIDSPGDTIVENANEGTDTVEASVSFDLSAVANVENLTLTGTSAINGTGNAGDNVIRGNSAANTLNGGGGADKLYGGAGDDTYIVNNAGVQVFELANEGNDIVQASVDYSLAGMSNIETLQLAGSAVRATGNAEHNTLIGTSASNVLDGGGGGDTLQGGAGNDVYYVRNAGDVIVEGAGEGTIDTVLSFVSYTLNAGAQVERLSVIDANATTAIDLTGNAYSHLIQGNAGVNTLTGGSGDDKLYGYGGNDTLYGGQGNDTLDGGTGTDMLYGGAGDDTYVVGDAHAKVIELAGEGNDIVQASVDYSLAGMSNIETLMLTGSAVRATGNGEHNMLIGNAGSNVLDGGGGGDTLQGGAGNDVYYVRNAGDVIVENANEGTADTVLASVSYTLTANAQVERLAASDANLTTAFNLTGNAWSHLIQGNNGANVLTGGSGDDTLMGYGGNDTLFGGAGADKFVFAHGTGQDTIGDFVSGTDKIDLTAFGFASYQDVMNATHDAGGNAVIDLGNGDQVTLTGVTAAQLHSGDFIGVGNGAAAPANDTQPLLTTLGPAETWHYGAVSAAILYG